MNRQGLSIVEALVAVAVLAVALAAIVPVFTSFARINTDNELRTGAVAAAQQVMDRLRQQPFGEWPASGSVEVVETGLRTYQVEVTYCTEDLAYCQSGSRHVRLGVGFNDRRVYAVETVYSRFD
jgi:type II secretory pathway pseudopilin PulG